MSRLAVLQQRYRPVVPVALAVVGGATLDRAVDTFSPLAWWCCGAGALLLAWMMQRRQRFYASVVTLLLAACCVGGAWHQVRWNYFADDDLSRFARVESQPCCLEVVLAERIERQAAPGRDPLRAMQVGPTCEATVRVVAIRNGEAWQPVGGNAELRVAGWLDSYSPGDRLRVFAKMGRARAAENPGQYDWSLAERARGRLTEVFCAQTDCVSLMAAERDAGGDGVLIPDRGRSGLTLAGWLARAQDYCERVLTTYIAPEESELARAILLGQREQLDRDTVKAFRRTGVVHLLVVSGLHVGMAAWIVYAALRCLRIPRERAFWLTALAIVAYAAITGFRPPVLRATAMALLGLTALGMKRPPTVANLLAVAALVVVAVNPSELFQAGTQLSFLTVAALFAYGQWAVRTKEMDPLDRLLRDSESWQRKALRWLGSRMGHLAVASLVAWIAAAPLTAMAFHRSAPGTVVVTPLLWPLVTLTMFSGLAVMAVGWAPPLATGLGWVCESSLAGIQATVDYAEGFEASSFYCAGPQWWWVLVLYGAAFAYARYALGRIHWRWGAALLAGWTAVSFAAASWQRIGDDELRCTFLSMGHGVCAVVELPGGQTLLYDAGSLNSPTGASRTIAEFLWSKQITSIDAIVLSHADVDHYNAVPGLAERFPIGVVYVSPMMFDPLANEGKLEAPEYLRELLAERQIPLREVWMSDRLAAGSSAVELRVLHPPREGLFASDNANSVLLGIEFGGKRILLPGDLEGIGVEAVIADPALDVDVLLAPHHGSAGSDPPGFAAWCTPEWVVVSGRSQERTLLANRSYREVGAAVLHTSEAGAVTFTIEQHGSLREESFLEREKTDEN